MGGVGLSGPPHLAGTGVGVAVDQGSSRTLDRAWLPCQDVDFILWAAAGPGGAGTQERLAGEPESLATGTILTVVTGI